MLMRLNRRGAAYVEFAAVLPLVLLVMVAALSLLQAVFVKYHLTHAASLGMQRMTVDGGASSEVEDIMRAYIETTSINFDDLEITATAPVQPYGNDLELFIKYEYPFKIFTFQRPITLYAKHAGTSFYIDH